MVSLDAMDRVVRVENASGAAARSLVTVQGGMRLRDLNAALEARGLALENLGATCEQSVAGATATGTHGTGRLLGSLSTQIVSLRLVTANGSVVVASAGRAPRLAAGRARRARCARRRLELTLAAVPTYSLRLNTSVLPLDALTQPPR